MTFDAAAFRAARIAAGFTQAEVAQHAHIDPSCVSEWESGKRAPTESGAVALLAALEDLQQRDTSVRRCSKCGEEKPLRMFPRDPKGRGGHSAQCGGCKSAAVLARRAHAPKTSIDRPLSSARLDRLLKQANVRYGPC